MKRAFAVLTILLLIGLVALIWYALFSDLAPPDGPFILNVEVAGG